MKSYSQYQQDLWVLSKFSNTKGFFVDVGCCDGQRISNTFLLEQNGWTGIAVDPFPLNFENRPNTILEKLAIYSHETSITFSIAGDIGGITDHIDRWKHHPAVFSAKKETIKTDTLYNILKKHNAPKFIHYLSLDTEGSEYEILKYFPFDEYTFGCMTIEHNEEYPKRTQIQTLLQQHNYLLEKSDSVEDYFVHS
jgi:FkbM family methyltransferase